MELKPNELEYICYITEEMKVDLRDVLQEEFPHATISIIRGHDNFSEESYTHSAHFSIREADRAKIKIKPNADPGLADTYHIVSATVNELEYGNTLDQKTEDPLDNLDIDSAYRDLKTRLERRAA